MDKLRMLTQEEVADILHTHITTVAMLREIGILPATKTGRNFMFTQNTILEFQTKYLGMDVSNKRNALKSYEIVENQKTEVA